MKQLGKRGRKQERLKQASQASLLRGFEGRKKCQVSGVYKRRTKISAPPPSAPVSAGQMQKTPNDLHAKETGDLIRESLQPHYHHGLWW